MSEPLTDRQRVEERWRVQLAEARKKYTLAVAQSKTARTDFRARTLSTPDGGLNMINALRAERVACDEYMRLLRVFTDLVVKARP